MHDIDLLECETFTGGLKKFRVCILNIQINLSDIGLSLILILLSLNFEYLFENEIFELELDKHNYKMENIFNFI